MSKFVAGSRADRLEVDACADCCFIVLGESGRWWCRHPRRLFTDFGHKSLEDVDIKNGVADDCPIVGSVTMVVGPRPRVEK